MKKLIILLTILFSTFSYSQSCECTEHQRIVYKVPPMDIFEFKEGKKLRICPAIRYELKGDKEIYFKDFRIENCENDKLLRYWSYLYCKTKFTDDTLTVIETVKLPIGKNRKFKTVNKSLTKIYFKDEETIVDFQELSIRRYSPEEIQTVLEEYNSVLEGKRINVKHLYSSLIVAGLSGNDEAKKYFLTFKMDFRGIFDDSELEDYDNLKSAFFPDER